MFRHIIDREARIARSVRQLGCLLGTMWFGLIDRGRQITTLLTTMLLGQMTLVSGLALAADKKNTGGPKQSCDLANAVMPKVNALAGQFGGLAGSLGKPIFYFLIAGLVIFAVTKLRKVIMENLGWVLAAVLLLAVVNSVYDALMPGGC